MTSVTQAMREAEERLLIERRSAAAPATVLITIAVTAFSLALLLFFIHYRLFDFGTAGASNGRGDGEAGGADCEEERRGFPASQCRLLQLQDEERRRFARELHDKPGPIPGEPQDESQSTVESSRGKSRLLAESIKLVDESITETRTLSYLLHPPCWMRPDLLPRPTGTSMVLPSAAA